MRLDDVQIDKVQSIIDERNRLRDAMKRILVLAADRTVSPRNARERVAGIAAGAIAVTPLDAK